MNSNQQNNKAKKQRNGFFKFMFFLALIIVVVYQTDSPTALAQNVGKDIIKQYWGYGDETTVIDCSACSTLSETGMKIKTALKSCPKRILLWNGTYSGNPQDYAPLYDCFWVDRFSSRNDTVMGIPVGIIEMNYSVTDPKTIARMQAEIDAVAWEILAKCPGDGDIFGDCLVIHDELIKRITYDRSLSFPHIYDIYGALVNGKAVCQGYAYAFSYLTNLLGYDSVVVISGNHAWNMINSWINCNERFIDVTWDDLDCKDSRGYEYIRYDYFGLTKEMVESIKDHGIVGINGTQQPVVPDREPFNYHEMYGYVSFSYSYDELVEIFRMQDTSRGRTAAIRYLTDASWDAAKSRLLTDQGLLGKAFREATGDYNTPIVYWINEEVRIITVAFQ